MPAAQRSDIEASFARRRALLARARFPRAAPQKNSVFDPLAPIIAETRRKAGATPSARASAATKRIKLSTS
jgi:hypothetical protein